MSAQDFSEQYTLDVNFPDALRNAYDKEAESFEDHVYVVMQWKESMDSFPATQGQCIRIEHDGIEQFVIVDSDDAHMPSPDRQARNANTILTAIKIEFGITERMKKIIDCQCYKTDDDKCIYPVHFEGHGHLSVLRPLSLAEIAAKAEACGANSQMLDNGFDREYTSGKSKGKFGIRLESLVEALQLDPSLDEAYLRLWFLRLYHWADRFRKTCEWQLPNRLPEVKDHRNNIAHRGVEKLDKRLLASFQKSLFGIIRDRISKVAIVQRDKIGPGVPSQLRQRAPWLSSNYAHQVFTCESSRGRHPRLGHAPSVLGSSLVVVESSAILPTAGALDTCTSFAQKVQSAHGNRDELRRTQSIGDSILVTQETTMTITINTTDDFLEALRSNPNFHEAARRELLTESLIGLPEEIAEFRAEMNQRTDRIQGHLNNLRGYDVELKMPSNLRQQVERRFGLTRVRGIWSSKVSIQPPSRTERFSSDVDHGVDSGLIEDSQGGRLLDTDMVIMARRGDKTVYVPAEASGVVNDDDIERVRDSAAFLRRLYPETEVIPAVYGYSIAGPQVRLARADDTAGLEQVHIFLDDSIA